jgi:hypothetical protein
VVPLVQRARPARSSPVRPDRLKADRLKGGGLRPGTLDSNMPNIVDLQMQMVLGCLGLEAPPFSQGALQEFRERLIAADRDRRVLARTVEFAKGHPGVRPSHAAHDAARGDRFESG